MYLFLKPNFVNTNIFHPCKEQTLVHSSISFLFCDNNNLDFFWIKFAKLIKLLLYNLKFPNYCDKKTNVHQNRLIIHIFLLHPD
jgi:hypothetical protein